MSEVVAPAESQMLSAVQALVATLSSLTDLAEVLSAAVCALREQFGYEQAAIHLTEAAGRQLALCAVADPALVVSAMYYLPWSADTVPSVVLATGRALRVEDFAVEPRLKPAISFSDRAEMSVPIRSGLRVVGTLTLTSTRPAAFTNRDESLLSILATYLSAALVNEDLLRRDQERAVHERLLTNIGRAINSSLKLEDVLSQAVIAIGEGLRADRCALSYCDCATQVFTTEHEYLTPLFVERRRLKGSLAHDDGWTRLIQSMQAGEVISASEDGAPEALQALWGQWMQRFQVKSTVWVPAVSPHSNKADGFYCLQVFQVTHNRRWTPGEVNLLQTIAGELAVAIRNAQLFAAVQESAKAVQAKNAEMETILYSVSHDLQAPVVSMRGFASLLEQRNQGLDDHSRNFINRIVANGDYLAQLLSGLLELSRIGRREEPSQPVDTGEVVHLVLTTWAPVLTARNIEVRRPDTWPVIIASRTRLRQVFENLLSNAVKFMGTQPAPVITLSWQPAAETPERHPPRAVEFAVSDNGIGIPPEFHERIFKPFERLNPGETEGTGIGLSIVKRIIEGYGGKIWVESDPAGGVTFRFTLPAAETNASRGPNP